MLAPTRRTASRLLLVVAALGAWRVGFYHLVPWVQRATGFERITNPATQIILGHWLAWQLPGVLVCVAVWLVGARLGLLPPLHRSLAAGGSVRRVMVTGLWATAVLLLLTVGLGPVVGGRFGFHPNLPKMVGDLVSNLYEEVVHRGLMFCAFYGVAAGATFPLDGKLDRAGLIVGTLGSNLVFAAGHQQYPLPLRAVLAVIAVVFVWPWVRARSLWASWICHTLGDLIGDTILTM